MPTINNDDNLEKQNISNLEFKNSNYNETNDEKNLENKKDSIHEIKQELSSLLNLINKKMQTTDEESFWVIDRFEENFAICENRETKEIRKININELPEDIKEGSVLKFKSNKYELDLEEEKKIEERISEKMKNIWND